jgi:hypothetical protein
MDIFGIDDLAVLTEKREMPCVSLFIPTVRKGHDTKQNRIRYKNLFGETEEILRNMKIPESRGDFLAPARRLLDDPFFELHQSEGLALFLARDLFRTYRLPIPFEQMVNVSSRFHVKPILPLFVNDTRFYILAFSQKDVRLFQCARQWVREVFPENLPKTLAEALRFDETEQHLQFHTQVAGATTHTGKRRTAMFHGHGSTSREGKDRIVRYFREIDKGLHEVLRNERVPLVLAGVEYLFSFYREANTYKNLLEKGIPGNPEELSARELHAQAWEIVGPLLKRERQIAIDRYGEVSGTNLGSDELKDILVAVVRGRGDVLFLTTGLTVWGCFDPEKEEVEFHKEKKPGDEDLLDRAAVETLGRGGKVYTFDPEEIPGNSGVSALFRY